jgi:hypothetical protein
MIGQYFARSSVTLAADLDGEYAPEVVYAQNATINHDCLRSSASDLLLAEETNRHHLPITFRLLFSVLDEYLWHDVHI